MMIAPLSLLFSSLALQLRPPFIAGALRAPVTVMRARDEYDDLNYRELQIQCTAMSLRANGKREELLKRLRATPAFTNLFDEYGRPVPLDKITNKGVLFTLARKRIYGAGQAAYAAKVMRYDGEPSYLFHYTTEDNAIEIDESGVLEASTKANNPKDVRDGEGQYFTSIPPWAEDKILLENNWGRGVSRRIDGKKVESYVRVRMSALRKIGCAVRRSPHSKDVWVLPGRDPMPIAEVKARVEIYQR